MQSWISSLLCTGAIAGVCAGQTTVPGGPPPVQKPATVEEMVWFDLFGVPFEAGNDMLVLIDANQDGAADVIAVDLEDSSGQPQYHDGSFDELLRLPSLIPTDVDIEVTIPHLDGTVADYRLLHNVDYVAGTLSNTSGDTHNLSGWAYSVTLETQPPELPMTGNVVLFFPEDRHLSQIDAIEWVSENPVTTIDASGVHFGTTGDFGDIEIPANISQVRLDCCIANIEACRDNAQNLFTSEYSSGAGIDWGAAFATGAAGALGSGWAARVGSANPAIASASIIGGLGAMAIYAIADMEGDRQRRQVAMRLYSIRIASCRTVYINCLNFGSGCPQ